MELRFVAPDLRQLDALSGEVVCCGVWEDERPMVGLAGLLDWRLAGRLSALLRQGFVTGAAGEVVMMPVRPKLPFEKVILFGLGARGAFDDERATRATRRLIEALDGLEIRRAVVELPGRADGAISPERAADIVRSSAEGDDAQDTWWLVEDARAEAAVAAGEKRRA